ncbi:multicopper oxidase family protein [Tsukamurella sp. DT100]|uniref:multicopper oxidase family protein n=1 Tax=Tsukamurella sp. DT100 TaxID=3393415 RepID=UPI003CF800DC
MWGYDGGYLGPTLEAVAGRPDHVEVVNRLGAHPLARAVDVTMGGATDRDRTDPRMTMHLHGGRTEPNSDGHPMVAWRNGGRQSNHYRHDQAAAGLWYHDHAMGITRLNVLAGLAGQFLLRDHYDTGGADNPLGLPSGDREIPLTVQDVFINSDGSLQARMAQVLPEGFGQMGLMGDVALVNGKAWPRLGVERALYRFRVLIAANTRTYEFGFSNGMAFHVIGTDQGLLDAPVRTSSVIGGPGERFDVLVDFSKLPAGSSLTLVNTAKNSIGNNLLLVPDLPEIMRFDVRAASRPSARLPARLSGAPGLPAALPPLAEPERVRTMTLTYDVDFTRLQSLIPLMMSINNLTFMSDDVDVARCGTVERWDIANITDFEHPIHLHLATFRVLERRTLRAFEYVAANPIPPMGTRWAPPPGRFTGPPEPAPAWEQGWKDTANCPAQTVTSFLVYWPSIEELGFDPDEPVRTPDGAEHTMTHGHGSATAMPATGHELRGYVWHCHNLEHEDHDMMQRIRARA